MSYSDFNFLREEEPSETPETALHDIDGARLYETEDRRLLYRVIYLNDIPRLKQYLPVYSPALDNEWEELSDPLCIAASTGRTEILRVLVDYYNADATKVPLHQRKFSLLTAACREAQLETVRFILDSQPALGSVHITQSYRDEALLATAQSLACLPPNYDKDEIPIDAEQWRYDRIARGEELMRLLLDGGASAQAVYIPRTEVEFASMILFGGSARQPLQPLATVLGLASTRVGSAMLKRLIAQGTHCPRGRCPRQAAVPAPAFIHVSV